MITTQQVRAQAAVQAFDFTEKLADYGFATGTRLDIETARTLIAGMVTDADTMMTTMVNDSKDLGQNPYKRAVHINGTEVKVGMEIHLFSDQELTARLGRAFAVSQERPVVPTPNAKVIAGKVCEELTSLARKAGYEVAGIEQSADGSPKRIVLIDIDYAKEALAKAGDEHQPVSISAMASVLREHAAKKPDATAEALGLTGTFTADQVLSVRNVANELVEQSLQKLMTHLQALKSSQVSPYNQEPFSKQSEGDQYMFIDKPLTGWWFGRYVNNPVVVDSIVKGEIVTRVQERLPFHTKILNTDTFAVYVRQSIIDRLRSVPEMPLAMAVKTYSNESLKLIFVSPDAAATARMSSMDRLFGKKPVLALPPPAVAPPVLLPAPSADAPAGPLPTTNGFAVTRSP